MLSGHGIESGAALLPQMVLGVEPTGYGSSTFRVQPHTGDLKWARGTVSTVAGNISAAWEKTANRFTMKLSVPAGTQAGVYLPSPDLQSARVNGKPLAEQPDIKAREDSGKWILLTLDPGDWQLECTTQSSAGT